MKQTIFSKRVAKQMFATLKDETSCWNDVRVDLLGENNLYATFRISQDDSITSTVMSKIISICDSFEMVYGIGTSLCSFEVYENKPVINVAVRIKK